ncbi:MAG: Rne/Rng family ribonuclease [Myxococcota bacterium]
MSRLLLINCRPDQRRVALIENGLTTELFFERLRGRSLVGNIYKGRVVRVLPGMQCAFVEAGLQRTAFLYVGDAYEPEPIEEDEAADPDQEVGRGAGHPPIKEVLQQGQDVLIQVSKEPIGQKGARVTTRISLPGRFVVFRPGAWQVGVSRRITDPAERERLREIAHRIKPEDGGLIVRTVAEGLDEEELRQDLEFLTDLWEDVRKRAHVVSPPELVHEDVDVTLRSIRDLLADDDDRVLVDDEAEAGRIRHFVERFMPGFEGAIELWSGPDPMFERFGLEWEIARAVRRKVGLKSGGDITIDRTEALTAIDINTGRFVGKTSFEETVLEINLEAAREIAYQLRFRDIGGLIVIDFVDMAHEVNRQRVRDVLVEELAKDKARSHVLPMSELGLIEMTRKRVRESIVQSLTEPCFYCDGRGYLRSLQVITDNIISRLRQLVVSGARGVLRVMAHPRVVEQIVEDCQETITGLEQKFDVQIELNARDDLHLEEIDIV